MSKSKSGTGSKAAERNRERRAAAVNPPGFLATQDLKDRGWTPRLIERFLGEHDATRPNGLRMGRRHLPPVKLYAEGRVLEVERDDQFLAAQAEAADARARAERARETRAARRAELLERAAQTYRPSVEPTALRRGAVRLARAPHLPGLEATLERLRADLPRLSAAEHETLEALLRARLDAALAAVYPWYSPSGTAQRAPTPSTTPEARPSDWRDWDWD